MSIQPGTKLGPYEVQEFIGQGAMGLVYRAYHAQLERTGAVKVLQALAPDRDTTARFRHEAQAIAQMRHPNILNVYDFGEYQGTPYMIVEYVPGGSLATRLSESPVDQATALMYLRGIAAGLDYAHAHGIVHRDVKPANVLLEKDQSPVLADFGLAKLLQGSSVKSMTGVTTGTPAYMAPEQVTGSQVGPAADRYSLATMAYEMLTGVIPFDGIGVLELLYAQVHRDPPPPSARRPELNARVDAVIMRGLAKDPQARWESCETFVAALAAALAGQPPPSVEKTIAFTPQVASTVPIASPPTAVSPARPYSNAPAAATVVEPLMAPKRASHRRRNVIAAAAAVIILLPVFALCVLAAIKPTISLSSTTVHAGDRLVVNGSHLPANQGGDVQLYSAVRTFVFKADGSGNVSVELIVPRDIGAGDHLVKLCWSGKCPVQATLHVLAPVALATPSPSPSSSSSSSPSPHPTASSGASPTPNPSPKPTPTPTPPPPPPPSPTPTPAASVTLVSVSALGNTIVTFHYFYAGSATLFVWQSGNAHPPAGIMVPVAAGSSTTVTFKTPVGILPTTSLTGLAHITACKSGCLTSNAVAVGA